MAGQTRVMAGVPQPLCPSPAPQVPPPGAPVAAAAALAERQDKMAALLLLRDACMLSIMWATALRGSDCGEMVVDDIRHWEAAKFDTGEGVLPGVQEWAQHPLQHGKAPWAAEVRVGGRVRGMYAGDEVYRPPPLLLPCHLMAACARVPQGRPLRLSRAFTKTRITRAGPWTLEPDVSWSVQVLGEAFDVSPRNMLDVYVSARALVGAPITTTSQRLFPTLNHTKDGFTNLPMEASSLVKRMRKHLTVGLHGTLLL